MSMSPTVPSNPNLGTLAESQAIEETGIPLYNAGDLRREFQVAGIFYFFEPRSVVRIKARKEARWLRNMTRDVDKYGRPRSPLVVLEGGSAQVIVDALLEKGQDSGLCRFAEDGLDDQRSAMAWERYIDWRCSRAREIQANWLATVARATMSPGALPPRQPENVRAEIAFLTDHAGGATDRKPWICRLDGYDCATRDELVAYLDRAYPDHVAQSGHDPFIIQRDHTAGRPTPPEFQPQPVAPRPQPVGIRPIPVKVVDDMDPAALAAEAPASSTGPMDTKFLLTKARELSVPLTAGELEGLIDGDVMTIENVTTKLAEASSAKRRAERGRA